ncbi:efflux RND transporter periplasmic adaptor subunit [Glutamicibacter sp. NPDC055491]
MSQRRAFRRIFLPAAWLVIGALIAVSLVKLAFAGGTASADDDLFPTGEIPAETIFAEKATVENKLSIPGTIKLTESKELNAPVDGVVNWAFVKPGDNVSLGDRIFQVRAESQPESVEANDSDSEGSQDEQQPQEAAPVVKYHDVYATATGKVGAFQNEVGDDVTKGTGLGAIQPQEFLAAGSIDPLDRYRLLDESLEATITIDGGPEPFTCKDLSVGDSASKKTSAGSADQDMESQMDPMASGESTESSSGSEISCAVPADIVVFDGLSMNMEIDAGTAEDVLTVPVSAVRGLVGQGAVWRLDENGKEIRTEVELGVTDGKVIEVISGLKDETEILRFVPGSTPAPEEMMDMESYSDEW